MIVIIARSPGWARSLTPWLMHASAGVVHRDIKPPNLILDGLGNLWVTDFGREFEEGDDLSKSQDVAGTLRYMVPERFRGVSDRRGDIYALGATLYEMLTLRHAFDGKDQLELFRRIQGEQPVPPRQIERRIQPTWKRLSSSACQDSQRPI